MMQPSGRPLAMPMQGSRLGAWSQGLPGCELRTTYPSLRHVLPGHPISRIPRLLGHFSTFAGVLSKLVQ